MKILRRSLAVAVLIALFALAWVWWNKPQRVDMASYAPADALVYLECNSLPDIADAVSNTDAWKALSPGLESSGVRWPGRWLRHLAYWTGLGPTRAVILSRAQVAVVMIDLGAKEEGQTLTFKPEAAILIETHTSESRVRPAFEETIGQFAERVYRQPTLRKQDLAGAEMLVWSAPSSDRQIAATFDGTLVIIGNSERAVKVCLEVHRAQRPSLLNDQELQRFRQQSAYSEVLTFGFVSSANAGRLLSIGLPILLGRGAGDLRFERTISSTAPKLSAGIGWSSHPSGGGIEDRYLFSLQPSVASRLQSSFRATTKQNQIIKLLPDELYASTFYKLENPIAAWKGFESAVSAQLDTLSAMLFTSILKSALTPYGIKDPEMFLSNVDSDLATLRLTQASERSVLIAKVRNEAPLRELLLSPSRREVKRSFVGEIEVIEIPSETIAVSFVEGHILIGPPEDVRTFVQSAIGNQGVGNGGSFDEEKHLQPLSNSACIVTYTKDTERILTFARTIARASGSSATLSNSTDLRRKIEQLPYATTETTVTDQGFERRTRSALGQFSSLVPLLFPEP